MKNNPMINNPYHIIVNGKLQKEDIGRQGAAIRDYETGEIQYCIPLNIEGMGMRNNFLYKILLIYVKTIFNEDEMFLDMKVAEDNMITMCITVFDNTPNSSRYVLGAAYVNHQVPQLEIDVLLDSDEKKIVNDCVEEIKKQVNWNDVSAHAYSGSSLLEKPKEAFEQILKYEYENSLT